MKALTFLLLIAVFLGGQLLDSAESEISVQRQVAAAVVALENDQ